MDFWTPFPQEARPGGGQTRDCGSAAHRVKLLLRDDLAVAAFGKETLGEIARSYDISRWTISRLLGSSAGPDAPGPGPGVR